MLVRGDVLSARGDDGVDVIVKLSEKIAQGYALPRGDWQDVDPRTKIVPPKRGKHAPYRRQPRRKGEEYAQKAGRE